MIRLFASDLDGTLFNALHMMDPLVYATLRRLTEQGTHFAVATGRFMRSNQEFGFAGLPVEAVCANGALIYGSDGCLLRHKSLDKAFLVELLHTFPQIHFDCTGTRHVYTTESRSARLRELAAHKPIRALTLRAMMIGDQRTRAQGGGADAADDVWLYGNEVDYILEQDIVKVNCRIHDDALRPALDAFLAEWGDRVINAPFDAEIYEITNRDVDKGEAVAWLAAHLGIASDEVAVYGDGGNDVAMLERFAPFGHAYAPSNACAAAKEAASETIGSSAWLSVAHHMRVTLRNQS